MDGLPRFNDNIVVAETPKKDKIEEIYDDVTMTVYMDIHYLSYNHIPDSNGNGGDGAEEKESVPDDIYVDVKLSSKINYEWVIDEKLLKKMRKGIKSARFCSDNFGLNGGDISDQYGFCICYTPKNDDSFGSSWGGYQGEKGYLWLNVMAKPMNVGKLVCDLKIITDLTWRNTEDEEEEIVEYKFGEADGNSKEITFEWRKTGEFDDFSYEGHITGIPTICLDDRDSVSVKVSIEVKKVFDMNQKEIDKSQWQTLGILCDD